MAWFISLGHEKGSLPLKSASKPSCVWAKRTSAIPSPSVPGSQVATNASAVFNSLFTHKGLPEINK